MYNRYIPQPDGTYRRRPADVPQSAPPKSRFLPAAGAAGKAALPEKSALFPSAQAGASRSPTSAPAKTAPAAASGFLSGYRQFSAPASAKGFLHGRPDGRAAAFAHVRQRRGRPEFCSADPWTLPFSVAKYAGFRRVETNPAYFLLRKREYCGRMVNTLLQEDST